MSNYIQKLKESSHINNFDYVEGLKAGLDVASQVADDLGLRLAGQKAFDELYDFVLEHSNKLAENKRLND